MNLMTDSLAECTQHIVKQCCELPMRLVLTPDQDLLVVPRAATVERDWMSIALPAGCDNLGVLVVLHQLLTMLMNSLQFKIKNRRVPGAVS